MEKLQIIGQTDSGESGGSAREFRYHLIDSRNVKFVLMVPNNRV